jgi:hypothetical protein
MTQYLDAEVLGRRQSLLPNGSLLCRDTVIARTGQQLYAPFELLGAHAPGADGMVRVQRDASEVFNKHSMASFEGIPVVMQHPAVAVEPDNWRRLSVGHAQNIRRDGDYLVADLLIHDGEAIDAIRHRGWHGISAGYDAQYEPTGPGQLRQTNIIGNHLAVLRPDEEPRCGAVCSINDAAPSSRPLITDAMRRAVQRRVKDEQRAARAYAQRINKFWQEQRTRG